MSVEQGIVYTNVLVYALDADAPRHAAARALLEAARDDAATTLFVTSHGGNSQRYLNLPAWRRRRTRQTDVDCGKFCPGQRKCSVLHRHHMLSAGYRSFAHRQPTKDREILESRTAWLGLIGNAGFPLCAMLSPANKTPAEVNWGSKAGGRSF